MSESPSPKKPRTPPRQFGATIIGFCPRCDEHVEADLKDLRCLQCREKVIPGNAPR